MQEKKINCKIIKESPYSSREERSKYSYMEYSNHFGSTVLDVGGFRGGLGQIFPGKYENIDMVEGADHKIDLDLIKKLPFSDQSYDTVVCTDVLEHLENIHLIFDEICRVARKSVIISMPNAWINVWYILDGIKGQFSKSRPKHLGDRHWTLPPNKPFDRHRWFYSLSEADEFIRQRSKKNEFEIVEYNPHIIMKKKLSFNQIIQAIHQKLWSDEDFINLYAWVGWWVLCRDGNN